MPTKNEDKEQPVKEYVSKERVSEQDYELEGVVGIHHDDKQLNSFANANANSGGSGSGLGMSSKSEILENSSSGGLGGMNTGSGFGDLSSGINDAGVAMPVLDGGLNQNENSNNSTENTNNSTENTSEIEQNTQNVGMGLGVGGPQEPTLPNSPLENLIRESKALENGETEKNKSTEEKMLTQNTDVSQTENNSQSTTNNNTQEKTAENNNEQSAVSGQTSNAIEQLMPTVEVDPNAALLANEVVEGKNAGVEAGCSIGLGKKVSKSGSEFVIGEDLQEDEVAQTEFTNSLKNELLNKDVDGVTDAELIQKVKEKREQGFNSGFNHGYVMGRQMKVDLKKAVLHNDPQYQEGLSAGEEAGTFSGSGNDEEADKIRAQSEAPDKTENYRKGFNAGFNKKYTEARQALVAKRHPSPEMLMDQSENYSKGFSWGEEIGIKSSKNEISDDELKPISALASEDKDASGNLVTVTDENNVIKPDPLYQKGYFTGFNRGYMSGRQVLAAEKKKANAGPEEGDPNHIHFLAGRFKGGLTAFLGEYIAIDALTDRNFDLSSIGAMQSIPAEVYDYFLNGRDLELYITTGLSEEEKTANQEKAKFFEMGYTKEFNKMYIVKRQNMVERKHSERTGHPDYIAGQNIGTIAGQAVAVKERLEKKLSSISDLVEAKKYIDKITKIGENLLLIEDNISNANEHYKQGYFAAYSLAYQYEVAAAVQSKKELRKNQAAQGSASGSAYGSGYEIGTKFGEAVAQKLASKPTAAEKAQVDSKISTAMNLAKSEGEDYLSGFVNAFNSAMLTGAAAPKAALDKDSQELKSEYDAAQKTRGGNVKNKTVYQQFYANGKQHGFDIAYKSYQNNEAPDLAKTLNKYYISLLEEIKENADPNNKDVDAEDRLPTDFKNESEAKKLLEEFKAGVNDYGLKMGEVAGKQFYKGFEKGKSGEEAVESDYYYLEGFKSGQSSNEYNSLRKAVLAAAGVEGTNPVLSNREQELANLPEEQRSIVMKAYKDGYSVNYNVWLKIFAILQGQQLPKDFDKIDINILGLSAQDKPGADVLLASKILNKKSDAANFKANDKKEVLQSIADNQGMSVDTLLEEFKLGYLAAVNSAEQQIEDNASDDAIYTIGMIHGLNKDNFLENAENREIADRIINQSSNVQNQLQGMQLSQSVFEKKDKYKQGKSRGKQMLILIQSGLASLSDFQVELQGPAYTEAYSKGYEAGESEAETAANEILEGNALPDKKEPKSNLNDELLAAYLQGFEEAYQTTLEYWKGYNKAYTQINNEDANDDFDNSVANEIVNRSSFQEGIRNGRRQGLLDKAAGTVNDAKNALASESLKMNSDINKLINGYNESFMESRADGIEAGYREAVKMPEAPEEGDNIAALKKQFALKGGQSIHEKIQKKLKNEIETAVVLNSENPQLGKAFEDIFKSLSDLKKPDDKLELSKKFKSLSSELPKAYTPTEGLTESDKRIITVLKEFAADYISEFQVGFEKGGELGLQDGIKLKALKSEIKTGESKTDIADDFFNNLQQRLENEGESAYAEGFEEAVNMAYRMVNTHPDLLSTELLKLEYHGITNIRFALRKFISDEYRLYKDEEPDDMNADANLIHRNIILGYRKILTALKNVSENLPDESSNIELFMDSEMEILFSELESGFEDEENDSVRNYFKDKLENSWKNYLSVFRKGFHSGFKYGNRQGLARRDGSLNSASAGADAELKVIHELLQAGKIDDALINDLDLYETQNELRYEAFHYRAIISKKDEEIFNTEEEILELMDEMNNLGAGSSDTDIDISEMSDEDFFELLNLDDSTSNSNIKILQEKINTKQEHMEQLNDEINEQADEYRIFMRETSGFEAPVSTISAIRDYLSGSSTNVELKGNFDLTEGNTIVNGNGELILEDSRERVYYYAELLMNLGDMTFLSSGLERDDLEYYFTMRDGKLTVPIMQSGTVTDVIFKFDRLDFEMGLGIIEQLEQQLHLDDALTGGNILSSLNLG